VDGEKSLGFGRVEGDEFDKVLSLPWAVEFAELDSLPGAEHELAAFDQDRDAVADEGGFHVAVAVAFAVLIVGFAVGDEGGEFFEHVVLDVGVGVFVDGDGGGGVGDADDRHAVLNLMLRDEPLNMVGDFEHLIAGLGLQGQRDDGEISHGLQDSSQGGADRARQVDVGGGDEVQLVAELTAVENAGIDEEAVEDEPEVG
jgi:hypothetical protein